jgi:molecular chaperone GrpE
MSDPMTNGDDQTGTPADTTAPSSVPEAAEPEVEIEVGPEQLKDIIGVLQAEIDTQKTQILRLAADMDNLRKRTEREKVESAKYAITKFARDIVGVADNFERAVAAVPQGAAEQDPALESLVEGVTMTERELVNVLERHGVTRIHPQGEMFNPHRHQAMMEAQNPDVTPGTILQVFQPGYLIDDRVLRPAMVVVAKGGAKPAKAQTSPEQAPDTGGTSETEPGATPPSNDDPSA